MDINPWRVDSILEFSFLKCPECTFDTKEEDTFQYHADKTEKVICPICSNTFTQIRYLNAHIATVHEGKKYKRKEKENKPIVDK